MYRNYWSPRHLLYRILPLRSCCPGRGPDPGGLSCTQMGGALRDVLFPQKQILTLFWASSALRMKKGPVPRTPQHSSNADCTVTLQELRDRVWWLIPHENELAAHPTPAFQPFHWPGTPVIMKICINSGAILFSFCDNVVFQKYGLKSVWLTGWRKIHSVT